MAFARGWRRTGWENGEMRFHGRGHFSPARWKRLGDLLYNTVPFVNNTVLYTETSVNGAGIILCVSYYDNFFRRRG